jgi:hypothetical protein
MIFKITLSIVRELQWLRRPWLPVIGWKPDEACSQDKQREEEGREGEAETDENGERLEEI